MTRIQDGNLKNIKIFLFILQERFVFNCVSHTVQLLQQPAPFTAAPINVRGQNTV